MLYTASQRDWKWALKGTAVLTLLLFLGVGVGGCDSVRDPFTRPVATQTLSAGAVQVNQIDRGQYGAITDGAQRVLRDNEEYASFWAALHANQEPVPSRPSVNFNEQVVVAVVLGQRPTGGYAVEVDEVVANESGERIQVRFTETAPGESCIVTQALTAPYVLVAVDAQEERFTFDGAKTTHSC